MQERASNSRKLLQSKAAVVNVAVKRRELITSCVGERDECKRITGEASKRSTDDIKTGAPPLSGKSMAATCLLAMWCPVYRWCDSNLGSRAELENLAGDGKGKGTSGRTARPKVPMREPGADCFLVVRKRGNARGAKGAGSPASRSTEVNWKQEEPADVGGRRQPSGGGTSRISREGYVRFRESLGVQFPGATLRCRATAIPAAISYRATVAI